MQNKDKSSFLLSPTDWADVYYTVYNCEIFVFPLAIIIATHLKIYMLLKRWLPQNLANQKKVYFAQTEFIFNTILTFADVNRGPSPPHGIFLTYYTIIEYYYYYYYILLVLYVILYILEKKLCLLL